MRTVAFESFSRRQGVLFTLTGWAALLSLEVMIRSPGPVGAPPLPERLQRQGVVLQRGKAADLPTPLPTGVVLLEAADYGVAAGGSGAASSRPPVRLRRLALTSSGTGVHLPVQELAASLLGPGGRGRCVVLDASGAVVREMSTSEEWQAAAAGSTPDRSATLAWLAGLRPYRPNLCLWESLP
jgi:hypothetical protein